MDLQGAIGPLPPPFPPQPRPFLSAQFLPSNPSILRTKSREINGCHGNGDCSDTASTDGESVTAGGRPLRHTRVEWVGKGEG